MSCCACCCFYPKYKRKVDNIYPRGYDLPLVKIEVEKLQYYVRQHPEKLSKIGDYLYLHLKWSLQGTYKNRNYAKNTVEAVEKILSVITPQNLNYYAASYLKIIQKLLEQGAMGMNGEQQVAATMNTTNSAYNLNAALYTECLEYQKMAAELFCKFCEKESTNESSSKYNANYDSFVCQFSSMCFNNNREESARNEIRSSGLQCLTTMVKFLVRDESLTANYLWDNMNKIVPGLLYIMHEKHLDNLKYNKNQENNIQNDEYKLMRYIDGEFYVNSRVSAATPTNETSNFILDEGDVKINKTDSDSVKIEFTRTTKEPVSSKQSSLDDVGATMLLQRKYSENLINDPDHEAKLLLKHLACKADFTTISKIVEPILGFLDSNSGWECTGFVKAIFLILMYNVKQQHAIVIQELIKHLDSHINSSAKLKCQIIGAISTCIKTAALHSVGTTGQIIGIFTYLIKHLKSSVEKAAQLKQQLLQKTKQPVNPTSTNNKTISALLVAATSLNSSSSDLTLRIQSDLSEEQSLQTKIIDAMGQFTVNLPDYSKNDVVTLIASQITSQQFNYTDLTSTSSSVSSTQQNAKDQLQANLRSRYFECLHEICTKYTPTQLFGAFINGPFLENLLRLTLVSDWSSSRKAHEIIQHLLDKYQMVSRIKRLKPALFADFSRSIVKITNKLNKSASSFSYNQPNAEETLQQQQHSLKSSTTSLRRTQTFLSQLDLAATTTTSRDDSQFMRRYGRILLAHLNENLFLVNNRRENYESIYVTTCLILIGLFNENEFLIDLIRFGFHVQELALLNHEHAAFSFSLQCSVHKFVCAYFILLAKSSGVAALQEYVTQVCETRKRKGLYHYIFPEYVLLETPAMTDSGIHSTRTSTTELELEFKRELQVAAKEFAQQIELDKSKFSNSTNQNNDENKKLGNTLCKQRESTSPPWLFCKRTMAAILDEAGFQTSSLFSQTKDFSLSFSYLQQTVKSVQTALKYRSPYSSSFDSLTNIRHEASAQNISSLQQNHSRGGSRSGPGYVVGIAGPMREASSLNGANTPRRSVDDSSMDDDTSYDSMSQVSMDAQTTNEKLFYIDPNLNDELNQLTVDSINFTKQQPSYFTNSLELTSFETIKKVLLNDTHNRTSGAASLVAGGSGVNGTILLPPASVTGVSNTSINRSQMIKQQSASHFDAAGANHVSGDDDSSKSTDTLETSMRIISDFKQKPFDELKQTLMRSNQAYMNADKYHRVFDSISKEIHHTNMITSNGVSTATQQNGTVAGNNNNNLVSSSTSSMYDLNESLGNASLTSASVSASATTTTTTFQQKIVPLNDIEFPQLFMY